MDWNVVLASGVVVAVITALKELLMVRISNKAAKEGKGLSALAEKIDTLGAKVDQMSNKLDRQCTATKCVLGDRLEYLATVYIKRGYITSLEHEAWTEMYDAQQAIGGNGHHKALKVVMDQLLARSGKALDVN